MRQWIMDKNLPKPDMLQYNQGRIGGGGTTLKIPMTPHMHEWYKFMQKINNETIITRIRIKLLQCSMTSIAIQYVGEGTFS